MPPSFSQRDAGSGDDRRPPRGERVGRRFGLTKLIIFGLTLGVGATWLTRELTRFAGRMVEARLEVPFAAVRTDLTQTSEPAAPPPLPARLLKTAPAALMHVHQMCAARAERVARDTPVPTLFAPMARGPNPEAAVVQGNAFLDCLMTEQPRRLCNEADRLHLAGAMHAHLVVMTQVRRARQMTTRDTKLMAVRDTLFGRAPPSTDFPSQAFDRRLTQRLRDLASRGYLVKRDFGLGWLGTGVPAEVDAAFHDIVPAPHACDA